MPLPSKSCSLTLLFLSIIIEIVLYIFNKSPIGMISAKKYEK